MSKLDNIKILFEDDDILVVDKPAGVMVHEDGKAKKWPVLTDWFLEKYPESARVGQDIETDSGEVIQRPGIVHRLDRETSGVMIVCKNQESFEFVKEQFKNREVEKTYNAFCYGEMRFEEGSVDKEIGRSKQFGKWTAMANSLRGTSRDALTKYKTLISGNNFSFVELMPKTGRTHQIRVHLQFLQNPVVADKMYAGKRAENEGVENLFFKRQALHAKKIKFRKMDGQLIEVESELPKDFQIAYKFLDEISNIC